MPYKTLEIVESWSSVTKEKEMGGLLQFELYLSLYESNLSLCPKPSDPVICYVLKCGLLQHYRPMICRMRLPTFTGIEHVT